MNTESILLLSNVITGLVCGLFTFYFVREKKIVTIELEYAYIKKLLGKIDDTVIDIEMELETVKKDIDGIADFVKTPKSIGLKNDDHNTGE